MPDEFDPFHGDTGLKDDYEGVVVDSFFQKDEQYDRMQLHLKVGADDGDETELRFAVGPDWASFDGGESVEHPKGANKGFNNKTAYYGLIKRAFEAGAEDELRRRDKNLYGGRGPMHAALWKGLRFHWGVVTESGEFRDKDTGQMKPYESSKVFPDKFIGVDPQFDPSHTSAQPAQPAPAPTAVTTSDGPLGGIPAPTAAAIKALANSKPYAEWVDDVMGMTDSSGQRLIENATLMQALGDEAFYNSLKG